MPATAGRIVLPGRARLGAVLAAAALTAWGGCSSSSTAPFNFSASMLAGTWQSADAQGDTISVTITVTDTVLSGSGWATNAQLRALSGGMVTEVPLTISGWVSPSREKLHLDATSPSVPLLAAQLDATVIDATHIAATWTITVNGAAFWTQTTVTTIAKT